MMSFKQFYRPLPDIGIFAKTRSGKDEVFKILDRLGFDVERVAFGDVMKERFHQTFPHIPQHPKPIQELITYGEAMRQIDTHVWVTPTMNRVQLRRDILAQAGLQIPTFVYTDIRNVYEYEAVKSTGAIMVKVHADEEIRAHRMLTLGETPSAELFNAPTELAMDNFKADFTVTNNGTIEDLEKEVTELIFSIHRKRNEQVMENYQNEKGNY
jgi:hypothetical protein